MGVVSGLEEIIETIVRRVIREELAAAAKPCADDHITIADYAVARSISPSTVRAAIRDGRLPAVKIGRAVRVPANIEIGKPLVPPTKKTPETPAAIAARVLAGGRR